VTEIVREFVGLPSPVVGIGVRAGAGGHPCQGIYHRPAGTRPPTAFIATHYNVDFSEHYLASFMAERGFGFLGWNTRFRGNEAHFLDPYDPRNGPPFSADFQLRYRAAQRGRNERITDWTLNQLDRLAGTRARDRLFTVSRSWADLRMIDPSIEPSDRRPNWCYLGDPMRANYGVFGVGTVSTLRSWLSMWSLRTSQCTAAPHLARITGPALVVHATADACVYDSDARALYHAVAAADKTLEFIKADHYLQEPVGARAQAADLISAWVTSRGG